MIFSAKDFWFLIKSENDPGSYEVQSIISFSSDEDEIEDYCKKLNKGTDLRFIRYEVQQGSFWP